MTELIAKQGGYRKLKSFQSAEIVFDLTFEFCRRYVSSFKMKEQMEGAARGGKQNIIEGSSNSGTSKQTELRLLNVARGSQEELKADIEDFLRVNNLPIWKKDDPRSLEIRNLVYGSDRTNRSDRSNMTDRSDRTNNTNGTKGTDRTYKTYLSYLNDREIGANCLLCLINQTCFLLDQQLKSLGEEFKVRGDFSDRKREIRKEMISGDGNDVYEKILRENGFKRLKNGRVVPIDTKEE